MARAQAPPVEVMGSFYPRSTHRRPRLGRSVDRPLAWMNIIPWNNEYTYSVSITICVGEGGLLRLLSPGSLGFHVAWDFRLGDGSYGWVWKAQRIADGAIVAVKIPKAQGRR